MSDRDIEAILGIPDRRCAGSETLLLSSDPEHHILKERRTRALWELKDEKNPRPQSRIRVGDFVPAEDFE